MDAIQPKMLGRSIFQYRGLTWRTHSCVPHRDSSRCLSSVMHHTSKRRESLDAARTSDVVEKVPEQFSWARLGDIKWSTASFRSRVGPLIALAFLDDLWAKTFSTTSRVRAPRYSPLCCKSLATNAVHPVWWLAPSPAPLSP